jgi:hypothetical protein
MVVGPDGAFWLGDANTDHLDRMTTAVTESARRNGREWSSPQVHAWTVKDRQATVFRQFQGDQQTEDEFWS